eukprot:gene7886-9994_t
MLAKSSYNALCWKKEPTVYSSLENRYSAPSVRRNSSEPLNLTADSRNNCVYNIFDAVVQNSSAKDIPRMPACSVFPAFTTPSCEIPTKGTPLSKNHKQAAVSPSDHVLHQSNADIYRKDSATIDGGIVERHEEAIQEDWLSSGLVSPSPEECHSSKGTSTCAKKWPGAKESMNLESTFSERLLNDSLVMESQKDNNCSFTDSLSDFQILDEPWENISFDDIFGFTDFHPDIFGSSSSSILNHIYENTLESSLGESIHHLSCTHGCSPLARVSVENDCYETAIQQESSSTNLVNPKRNVEPLPEYNRACRLEGQRRLSRKLLNAIKEEPSSDDHCETMSASSPSSSSSFSASPSVYINTTSTDQKKHTPIHIHATKTPKYRKRRIQGNTRRSVRPSRTIEQGMKSTKSSNLTDYIVGADDPDIVPPYLRLPKRRCRQPRNDGRDRPYACSYPGCGKRYIKSSHLKTHLRSHSGERPYACPYDDCHWAFSRADELKRHLRTHTGARPYKCDICDRTFTRSDHLSAHMKTHDQSKATSSSRKRHTAVS